MKRSSPDTRHNTIRYHDLVEWVGDYADWARSQKPDENHGTDTVLSA
jgi:hypothetical protein